MSQDENSLLLTAAIDGELDVGRHMELQLRLARDPALKAAWERQLALRATIREGATYHEAPASLKERLTASVVPAPAVQPPRLPSRSGAAVVDEGRRRWALAAGAAFAASLLGAGSMWLAINASRRSPAGTDRLAGEAVAAHVRAAMVEKLIEVASSDQHTVRPWLSAKMTFSPPVPDLSNEGFELAGGRRDVIDGQPVAVLVYRRRQHVISVFVRPVEAKTETAVRTVRGFNVVETAHGGMSYWIVSDLNQGELAGFVGLLQSAH